MARTQNPARHAELHLRRARAPLFKKRAPAGARACNVKKPGRQRGGAHRSCRRCASPPPPPPHGGLAYHETIADWPSHETKIPSAARSPMPPAQGGGARPQPAAAGRQAAAAAVACSWWEYKVVGPGEPTLFIGFAIVEPAAPVRVYLRDRARS